MNIFILTDFVEVSLSEFSKANMVGSGILKAEVTNKELIHLLEHGQSCKHVLLSMGQNQDVDKIDLSQFNFKDFFWPKAKFKVEVKGVKGNENRMEIGKKIGTKIFDNFKELEVNYKQAEIVVLVYFDGKEYFVGIDLGGELSKRSYRVFVNPASLKGDLGYYLLRKSGFKKKEKLVVGFVKDGTIAIEAALFNSGEKVNKINLGKYPVFNDFKESEATITESKVYGFDESINSVRAAKKNAKIAKVGDFVFLSKHNLDELDVKFSEGEIDRLIFQVTKKDEDNINEIYYQANYILRKGGNLMLIGRKNWEVTVSDKFKSISEEEIVRGESCLKYWLMKKK